MYDYVRPQFKLQHPHQGLLGLDNSLAIKTVQKNEGSSVQHGPLMHSALQFCSQNTKVNLLYIHCRSLNPFGVAQNGFTIFKHQFADGS